MRIGKFHPKNQGTGGFTLAELLVVIAIIAIMFAVALPALVNMTGTSKLDSAANAVHSAAKLARQYALTHSQPTYLVLDEYTNSYAVFTINIDAQPVTQDSGEFLTDWEALPEGIVFEDQTGGTENVFSVSPNDEWNGAISKNNVLNIQGTTYVVLGTKPDGEAASATHSIYLAEGFYNNGQVQHTSKQGKQIHFDITGQSQITSILYNESGEPEEPAN